MGFLSNQFLPYRSFTISSLPTTLRRLAVPFSFFVLSSFRTHNGKVSAVCPYTIFSLSIPGITGVLSIELLFLYSAVVGKYLHFRIYTIVHFYLFVNDFRELAIMPPLYFSSKSTEMAACASKRMGVAQKKNFLKPLSYLISSFAFSTSLSTSSTF